MALIGLLCLLGVVAIAATGSATGTGGGSERPADWAIDVVASLVLVALVPGSLLLVFVFLLRPEALARAGGRQRRRGRLPSAIGLGLAVLLIVLAVRRLAGGDGAGGGPTEGVTGAPGGGLPERGDAYEPSFAVVPVVVTLSLLLVGAVAALLAFRSRARLVAADAEEVTVALGDVLDEALDDLRAEADARRAVIAAYARLERVLGAYGLPRRPSEAPEEYLSRVLSLLEVSRQAVTRLTALFETAKFSQHDVEAIMKDEAIDALESARDELRAAAAREREARDEARALAREQAAG